LSEDYQNCSLLYCVPSHQGRNFGLKSGGTDSEGQRGACGFEAKGEENGEEVFPSDQTMGSGRASRALSRGPGGAPAEIGLILISTDLFC